MNLTAFFSAALIVTAALANGLTAGDTAGRAQVAQQTPAITLQKQGTQTRVAQQGQRMTSRTPAHTAQDPQKQQPAENANQQTPQRRNYYPQGRRRQRQDFFGRLMEVERRKNAWFRRTFFSR